MAMRGTTGLQILLICSCIFISSWDILSFYPHLSIISTLFILAFVCFFNLLTTDLSPSHIPFQNTTLIHSQAQTPCHFELPQDLHLLFYASPSWVYPLFASANHHYLQRRYLSLPNCCSTHLQLCTFTCSYKSPSDQNHYPHLYPFYFYTNKLQHLGHIPSHPF